MSLHKHSIKIRQFRLSVLQKNLFQFIIESWQFFASISIALSDNNLCCAKPPIDRQQNPYHKFISSLASVIEKTCCLICSRWVHEEREMMTKTTHLMMSNCTPLDMKTPIIKMHEELRGMIQLSSH